MTFDRRGHVTTIGGRMVYNVVFRVFIVEIDMNDIIDGCFLGGRRNGLFQSRFWGDAFGARTAGNAGIDRNETVNVVFTLDVLRT